jgi:molybdopterin-guanine dinucleotide biosynthesis protein A
VARLDAGIVLAGGRSTRMGRPKAALEWHGSTLLRRVAGVLRRSVDGPVVVVRAAGQPLPALPPGIEVVDDPLEARGPLVGILAGLHAVGERAEVAYVSSTDAPGLTPAFVRRVLAAVDDDADVALPDALGHRQPLAAAYRTSLVPLVEDLVAAERLRPAFLFERVRVRVLGERELAPADPGLGSLRNLNEPADYDAARAEAPPAVRVDRFGTLRPAGAPSGGVQIRAATLGAACAAVGVALDGHVVAALNGDHIVHDPEVPLVAGDVVALMTADAGG